MNSLFSVWMRFRSAIPVHLKPTIEKLSITHSSGIRLEQLDSPMMKQFKQAKDEVPDALLFFRMGDFFELFGLDAIIASDICDLTLTSRDKSQTNPIPMAGVPVASYKNALKKCLDAGFKVAVCDQVEDPRFVKGIVKREITRIATPSIPGDLETDDDAQKNIAGCYLASIINTNQTFVFAYIDCSTGEFQLTSNLTIEALKQEVLTIKPKEILIENSAEKKICGIIQEHSAFANRRILFNKIDSWLLRSEKICKDIFLEFFSDQEFHQFGLSTIDGALLCVAAILSYLKNTQKNIFKNIRPISYYVAHNFLLIDDATKKNLDFFETSSGEKRGSLFSFLNECQTPMGSRMLMRLMNYPSKTLQDIQNRLNFLEELFQQTNACLELQKLLSQCYDVEKLLARASQKSLDTKSIFLLKLSLNFVPNIFAFLNKYNHIFPLLTSLIDTSSLQKLIPLHDYLHTALIDDPLDQIGQSVCVFRKGHSNELDELYELENNFNQKLEELEKFERTRSNISTLKIGYTRVFGYYFEISRGKLASTPTHFKRKQTLANAERFITDELKDLEEKALSAKERREILEQDLFENIRLKILEFSKEILEYATLIATIDTTVNFAQLAYKYGWIKPHITETSETELIDCYHPIMKHLVTTEEEFIPNTVQFDIDTNRIHLITGPNMAGKSTLMRQVAINQFLCQIGSFVCAQSAKIGIADRILSRIGSGDHTLKNQSTFMVEMLETASILKFATHQSLLLIDEVGRGTSTYDGMSIAWAVLEHLHDTCCPRTLFSTHYHELVQVCKNKPAIVPMQMGVFIQHVQHDNSHISEQLVFSRKYTKGSVGQSFGINVALLAGLPLSVIERAKTILKPFEKSNLAS